MLIRIYVILSYLAVVLFCYLVRAESPQQEKQNAEKRIDIHFDDLKNNYRIIGRLGKPVGEYYTIHGTWKRFDFSSRQIFFHVTHVDFQPLPKPLIYPERHLKLAHSWATLKLKVDPDNSPVCEYRVWESLEYFGTPDHFWKESNLPPSISILPGFAGRESKAIIPLELTSELNYVKAKVLKQVEVKENLKKSTISEHRIVPSSVNSASGQADKRGSKGRIDIGFYDLRDRYQIIGKLGKPLGEYSSISGVWKRERTTKGNRVHRLYRFYVTHIDGRTLDKSVIFDRWWDTISSYGVIPFQPPVPDPAETEIWKLRVVELMRHRGLPYGFNGEAGLIEQHNRFFELDSVLRYHHRPQIVKSAEEPTE